MKKWIFSSAAKNFPNSSSLDNPEDEIIIKKTQIYSHSPKDLARNCLLIEAFNHISEPTFMMWHVYQNNRSPQTLYTLIKKQLLFHFKILWKHISQCIIILNGIFYMCLEAHKRYDSEIWTLIILSQVWSVPISDPDPITE